MLDISFSFKQVGARSTLDLIEATVAHKVTCVVLNKSLNRDAPLPFASSAEIEDFEKFVDQFEPDALVEFADDGCELSRPIQASWRLANGALQRRIRAALAALPAYIAGSETEFTAFIPMGPLTDLGDGQSVYIPGYLIDVAQEGPEACLWTHTLRARYEDTAPISPVTQAPAITASLAPHARGSF